MRLVLHKRRNIRNFASGVLLVSAICCVICLLLGLEWPGVLFTFPFFLLAGLVWLFALSGYQIAGRPLRLALHVARYSGYLAFLILMLGTVISIIGSFMGFYPLRSWVMALSIMFSIPAGVVWLLSLAGNQIPDQKTWQRVLGWRTLIVLFCVGLMILTLITQWPLRLVFNLNLPTLERLADQAEKGETLKSPVRVGTFLVRKLELRNSKDVFIWIDADPSEFGGFIRTQRSRNQGYNYYPADHLSGNWYLYYED
jgi:hypothetical protein